MKGARGPANSLDSQAVDWLLMSDEPGIRAQARRDLLRRRQQPDGRWVIENAQYWRGTTGTYGDPAGWNATSASQMLTLNALRVLNACS